MPRGGAPAAVANRRRRGGVRPRVAAPAPGGGAAPCRSPRRPAPALGAPPRPPWPHGCQGDTGGWRGSVRRVQVVAAAVGAATAAAMATAAAATTAAAGTTPTTAAAAILQRLPVPPAAAVVAATAATATRVPPRPRLVSAGLAEASRTRSACSVRTLEEQISVALSLVSPSSSFVFFRLVARFRGEPLRQARTELAGRPPRLAPSRRRARGGGRHASGGVGLPS